MDQDYEAERAQKKLQMEETKRAERRSKRQTAAKWAAGSALVVSSLAYGINWFTAPVVKTRDVALKIHSGILVNDHVTAGRKMDHWVPGTHYDILPGHQLSTTIKGQQDDKHPNGDGVIVRSKDNTQILGNYIFLYHLNHEDPNVGHVYTKLRIDGDIDDNEKAIEPIVNQYVRSVIAPVYKKVPTSEINTEVIEIREQLRQGAQQLLDKNGYSYIVADDFLPSGTGLTPSANTALEGIVDEQRKSLLFDAQKVTAVKAKEVSKIQTEVTIENLKRFKEAGLTNTEALQAYQLQLMRDNGKIGTPGVLPPTANGALVPTPGH